MVFPSFIRLARLSTRLRQARIQHPCRNQYRKPFFQASFPYLNTSYYYQGLSKRYDFFHRTRWWTKAETGSTSHSQFMGIADGHYGLYFSMYNQECDRKDRQEAYEKYTRRYMTDQLEQGDRTKFKQCMFMSACRHHHHRHRDNRWSSRCKGHRWSHNHSHRHFRRLFHVKLLLLGIAAKFIISKAIKDTQIGLDNLKTATNRLSSLYYAKPAAYFINNGAGFHSSGLSSSHNFSMSPTDGGVFSIGLSKRSFTTASHSHFQQLTKTSQILTPEIKRGLEEEPFETSFLQSQITQITNAFERQSDKKELNIIYPLYQGIKRNELTLPTVELYNIVLKSIIDRPVDNEANVGAIERKLTNLLTVYQDILYANLKPNEETFNLVVNEMLDSTIKCSSVSCANDIDFRETSSKAKEFAQIAFELVESSTKHVSFRSIFDKVVTLSKTYPSIVSDQILEFYVKMVNETNCNEASYYLDVLEFSAFLPQLEAYNEQDAYRIIESTYNKIKNLDSVDEFAVYQSMMNALVYNNQLGNACQLLDNILIDYKDSLQFATRPSKKQVSDLIATFLKAYANQVGVVECLDLLKKFQNVSYLPELPVSFYNFIIVRLQEFPDKYDEMWQLYNRVALRVDFQSTSTIDMMKDANGLCCRDVLLGLAICKGDHERVFQLIKEIMLKEHLIGDDQVFRMALGYLNNGIVNTKSQGEFFNQYYLGLLHQLLLAQSKHYQSSIHINEFVSQFVQYLTIAVPPELANNEVAVASVSNYNVQLLMNSTLPFKAVEEFDLQMDNLYGLSVIARHLLLYSGADEQTLLKVADFEAHLINQFEDVGNHYIQLTNDVAELKTQLKVHFSEIVGNLTTTTAAIEKTCGYLNIPHCEVAEVKISFDQDLSCLLNINYHKGASSFIDLFQKGFTFDIKTWSALLNQNFMNEYLSRINVGSMLDRFWMLECEEETKLALLKRLISFNDEQVNGEILEFVCRGNIFSTDLLMTLFQSSVSVTGDFDFELAYSRNVDMNWIVEYFNYLKQSGKFEEISKCCALIKDKSEEVQLFALEAAFETGTSEFAKVLETSPVSLENPKLIELQIKYDIKSGVRARDILDKNYPSMSPQVVELLSFVKFLDSLQHPRFACNDAAKFVSLEHMASSLLACGNLQQMKTIVDANAIESKHQLVSTMLQMLIDAVPYAPTKSILDRFMLFIKFYKVLQMGCVLPVESFLQVIQLLKVTKSELLPVLTNRMMMTNGEGVGGISDIVNFYFLEVQLFDKESKQLVYNYLETN
ncbi:RPM2 [Candida metapsilosis]|uniref:RPM2 n=1 Tax=Candida metapsilosis TaxID=273372 RepID=A0A8H7ZH41_9ASCO|nr:RPM2 [Candida metapsilosis]